MANNLKAIVSPSNPSCIPHPKHALRDLLCVLLRKTINETFMSEPPFAALPIVVEADNAFVGQYPPRRDLAGRLKRIFTRLAPTRFKS